MERWRTFFGKSGTDIWTVIEQAIILAATDCPTEFKNRRSDIAETLFSRALLQPLLSDGGSGGEEDAATRASVTHLASNTVEESEVRMQEDNALALMNDNRKWERRVITVDRATRSNTSSVTDTREKIKGSMHEGVDLAFQQKATDRRANSDNQRNASLRASVSTASNMTSNPKEIAGHHDQKNNNPELQAQTDEAKDTLEEVQRIKETLQYGDHLEESTILECLERLECMRLSYEILQATEIGKTVNGFRKHPCIQIRAMIKPLVMNWKEVAGARMDHAEQGCKAPARSTENQENEHSENPESKNHTSDPSMANDQTPAASFSPPPNLFRFLEDELLTGKGGHACDATKTEATPIVKANSYSSSMPTSSNNSDEKKVKTGCSLVFKVPKRKEIIREDSDIRSAERKPEQTSKSLGHNTRRDSLPKTIDRPGLGKSHSSGKTKFAVCQTPNNNQGNLTLRFANADRKAKVSTGSASNFPEKAQVEKLASNKRKVYDGYQQAYDGRSSFMSLTFMC